MVAAARVPGLADGLLRHCNASIAGVVNPGHRSASFSMRWAATLKETLINERVRARVAFACEQGAVTAVQSFCTREPQRRARAKAAEPPGVGTPGSPILRCAAYR